MDLLRKIIRECVNEATLDEERISNKEATKNVQNKENFIGSHVYGEDIGKKVGKPNLMYVAYSYGEQHPLYVWVKNENSDGGKWYYNFDEYYLEDGTPNIWTKKHLKMLNPTGQLLGRGGSSLKQMIKDFKKKYGIGDNSHSDLEPGEK